MKVAKFKTSPGKFEQKAGFSGSDFPWNRGFNSPRFR